MDKLQFYKEKTAPGQEFILFYFSTFLLFYFSTFLLFYFSTFLLFYFFLATLAKLANSTILQEYAYTPHLDSIWPGWPNYSSTRKKQLLVKNLSLAVWPLWPKRPILQFYKNMHTPPLKHYLARVA
jgi:hypothetical protein